MIRFNPSTSNSPFMRGAGTMGAKLVVAGVGWLFVHTALAQAMQHLPATGFNVDGVAESLPALNSTDISLDGSDHALYVEGVFDVGGVPADGVVGVHRFEPYGGPNLLMVDASGPQQLTLLTPTTLSELSFLGFATEDDAESLSITVNFADGSSQVFNSLLPDWFSPQGDVALSGFQRLGRTDNQIDSTGDNPSLYDTRLSLSCANRTKPVTSVSFAHDKKTGYAFAVSLAGATYSPTVSYTLRLGETLPLTASEPGGAWFSSDEGGSTVDAAGRVRGVQVGQSTVRYEAPGGGCQSYAINVVAASTADAVKPVPVSSTSGLTVLALLAAAGAGAQLRRRKSA